MIEFVVVTGASGFLGRAVVSSLVGRQMKAVAVSRHAVQIPGAEFIGVTDYRDTPCPPGASLIHLAEEAAISAAAGRGDAHVDEVRERVTALATKGFRRIVYASSGQVYRVSSEKVDPYVRGKRAAEMIVDKAGGVIARLANIYGPRINRNTLIGDILRQIPGEGPLRLRNTEPRRDFLWIADAAESLVAAGLGRATGCFDVGSGKTIAAGDVARLALAVAGQASRSVISCAPASEKEADEIALDIAPMAASFNWHPRTSLQEGLSHLLTGLT